MSQDGHLLQIWSKSGKGAPMIALTEGVLDETAGLLGSYLKSKRRAVTLLDEAAWAGVTEALGIAANPILRRANLFLRGIPLKDSKGRRLKIGAATLEILGETEPCGQMDAAMPGLRAALETEWRGGAYARVITGGPIRIGDAVAFEA